MGQRWHVITGEYPPQFGGVADYTQKVACGLARAGDEVLVWAPPSDGPSPNNGGVQVRRLRGHFGPLALSELNAGLTRQPGRILLQYTPHAFGLKAMNLPLCVWLWARRRRLDVMFHEVAFPFIKGQPLKHKLLACVHRVMASLLLRAAQRVFVSVPGWTALLRPLAPRFPRPIWAPVPSNLPTDLAANEIEAVRSRLCSPTARLVGHFGTYSPLITALLEPAIMGILTNRPDAFMLLLGQGSSDFAARILTCRPELADRFIGLGALEARAAALHIACCDVLLQPFPDGVSSRRSSVMAALALKRAVVTNEGGWSEPVWRESQAVELAAGDALGPAVLTLLDNSARRTTLGERGADLYQSCFSLEHTIAILRSARELNRCRL